MLNNRTDLIITPWAARYPGAPIFCYIEREYSQKYGQLLWINF